MARVEWNGGRTMRTVDWILVGIKAEWVMRRNVQEGRHMTTKRIAAVEGIALIGALMLMMSASAMAQSRPAPRMTDKEVVALLDSAKSPADHEKLAAYFDDEAQDFEAKASKHKALAAAYRRIPPSGNPRIQRPPALAAHCEGIATEAAKAAKEAHSMVEHHRMLAKDAAAVPAR